MSDTKAPIIMDAMAALAGSLTSYFIQPRTKIGALLFADVTGTFRFRFTEGTPWITARSGDYYEFCPPLQTGVQGDFAGTPTCVVMYADEPAGLGIG